MKRLLLAVPLVLFLASPAQAQTRIAIDCDSVEVEFRTSIQPDSATVEIVSDAGAETHSVTLAQGGTEIVSFPLDGQNGEAVAVNVTLVHAGVPNVTSATETLEGCAGPSPSPSPSPIASPTAPAPIAPAPVAPTIEPSPEPTDEIADAEVITRTDETTESLPEELAYTGFSQILGLVILAGSLIGLGFYARSKGYRRSR